MSTPVIDRTAPTEHPVLDVLAGMALIWALICGAAAIFLTMAYFVLSGRWPWQ